MKRKVSVFVCGTGSLTVHAMTKKKGSGATLSNKKKGEGVIQRSGSVGWERGFRHGKVLREHCAIGETGVSKRGTRALPLGKTNLLRGKRTEPGPVWQVDNLQKETNLGKSNKKEVTPPTQPGGGGGGVALPLHGGKRKRGGLQR